MTIEEMREKKIQLGYTYEQIAELSHVPLGTVQKIFSGITKAPRYQTLRALEQVFHKEGIYDCQFSQDTNMVRESGAVYRTKKSQGRYHLEDYYNLPDEHRAELIDGVFYDMASPSYIHQLLVSEIHHRFYHFIREQGGECISAFAPLDVQLDRDDCTMVQPDVVVVCDRNKILKRGLYGAPDLVVEILSQSTKKKDSYLKLMKYEQAGVREYWLVDPDKKCVVVYDLENQEVPSIYGFEDVVPVRIFDGKCRVDFSEIYDYIRFLYEKES